MPMCRIDLCQRGFTLLELMVVMVILGLVTSMTLPAMQRWHDGLLARAEASTVVEALQAAAFEAAVQRRDLRLDAQSFVPDLGASQLSGRQDDAASTMARAKLTLPPGWQVGRSVAAVFGANGLCRPGLVALRSAQGTPLIFTVKGPICGFDWTRDLSAESHRSAR